MAINEKQVEVFMSLRTEGKNHIPAAAKAGISERTGRRVEKGEHRPGKGRRSWRTRTEPTEDDLEQVADGVLDILKIEDDTATSWDPTKEEWILLDLT